MTARPRQFISYLSAVALLVSSAAFGADPVPWEQDKVIGYAETFSTQVNGIYRNIARNRTGATIGSGQSHSYLRLKDSLRLARNEAHHLERQLQEGKNRDETYPVFERLMSVIRSARDSAQRMFLEQSTVDKISTARDTLRKLAPYYNPDLEAEFDRAEKALGGK